MINSEYHHQLGAGVGSCRVCSKSVFLTERLLINGNLYHCACFRCARCNTQLNIDNTNNNYNNNNNNNNVNINNDVMLCDLCINNDRVNNIVNNDVSSSSPLYNKPSSLVTSRRLLFENISDDAKAAKMYKNQNSNPHSPTLIKSIINNNNNKSDMTINNNNNEQEKNNFKKFHENGHQKEFNKYSNSDSTPNDHSTLQNDITTSTNCDTNEYNSKVELETRVNSSKVLTDTMNDDSKDCLHSKPSRTDNSSYEKSKDDLDSRLDVPSNDGIRDSKDNLNSDSNPNTPPVAMGDDSKMNLDSTPSESNTNLSTDAIKIDSNDEIYSSSTNIILDSVDNSNDESIIVSGHHLNNLSLNRNVGEDHLNSRDENDCDVPLEVINDISHSGLNDSCTDNEDNENSDSCENVENGSPGEHELINPPEEEDSSKSTEVSPSNQQDHDITSVCSNSENLPENSVPWTQVADKMEDELSKKFEDNLEISDSDKTPKKSDVKIKVDSPDYPEDLNPFGEDEDDENCEDSSAIAGESTNPFDTDTDEERNTNPFWSGSDEEEDLETKMRPVPLPRTIKRTTTPVPSPRQSLAGKSNLSISSTSLSSQKSTPRKKKPAPQPPVFKTKPVSAVSSGPEISPENVEKQELKMYNRKKGPAPARPKPERRSIRTLPLEEITKQLSDIEVRQLELERQGVKLEQMIREKSDTGDAEPAEPAVEEMVLQLFECVNEKNSLFRQHSELVYLRRMQKLDEEHADTEYKIRCLMLTPESNRTDQDKRVEEQLITRLVEIVEKRNELIEKMEEERNREAAEDSSVSRQLDNDVLEEKLKTKKKKKKKSKEEKEGSEKSPSKKFKEKFMTLKHTAKKLSPKT